jgi:NAD(P) transhydrogenase subunit beta
MNSGWQLLVDFAIIAILILGIWQFRTPRGARTGNLTAALALLCAVGVVWHANPVREPATVVLALAVGGAVGCLVAARVNMIQIPAMVAFQHGAGGVAAFVTSFVELTRDRAELATVGQWSGVLGVVIGAATFSGSMVASAKLAGVVRQTPIRLPRHGWILAANLVAVVAVGGLAATAVGRLLLHGSLALILLSILLGVVFAVRIGGADMPVLISFLNATAGMAASFCGIIIENRMLVACGATVAASGSILTHVMCRAMNRNLLKVFVTTDWKPVGGGAPSQTAAESPPPSAGPQAEESPGRALSRAVEAARSAEKIILIPGYGMALAHAQFEVVKLANRLKKLGKEVKFAIHPIAGRMPGHMHVLLAEAEADSDMLFDLPEINAEFREADLALVVGACDVVNPAAIHVEGTPISGMPILAAHEAKHVLVCNLDELPGYSGVKNPLYADPKTILMLGDAKSTLSRLLQALVRD